MCTAQSREALLVCTAQSREALRMECASLDCAVHTHTHHGQICCHNTDYVHINRHDKAIIVNLAKHYIGLPDDGSLVIQNMLEQF